MRVRVSERLLTPRRTVGEVSAVGGLAVAVAGCSTLRTLNLADNPLAPELPLDNWRRLEFLDISDIPLDPAAQAGKLAEFLERSGLRRLRAREQRVDALVRLEDGIALARQLQEQEDKAEGAATAHDARCTRFRRIARLRLLVSAPPLFVCARVV